MICQNVARASRSGLRSATLLGRRTLVTQEERWTLETARNAGAFIEGPNKVQLSHVVPNIEASWKTLSKEEQYGVFRQLEELQRKDWKELSLDEKKAAYFVSFGPHGPRKPLTSPGQGAKTLGGVLAALGITSGIFYLMRANGGAPVKTMTKEWQEASNELALEQKQNPITGIASENYKGKGHVQSA
ncbi:putative cytochrome-c oxidase chain V precursor [Mycosarcoma maydis]|uniref:Cytochrome-c oxidase chain V n=1 Tax=Mycosarcoma maydis TaxID=5270 RepID=A0A0D1DRD6_MYCMD|nr:putative cytochrome-c oxidase chain V precursor [Ustilago maydis 521]KIS66471.1 putative cytochrome-c oxidase chain V precursor [Ustilago maydis 521]|eukprot:XP_011391804.1 putative cytochrome-c oxidase chain V precursor [Ustilago maydis 521]